MSYVGKFWSLVISPEWMANTGVPLVFTLAGLGVAYVFLRRQLRSDRVLRAADRHQEAALGLGSAIAEALKHLELPATDPFWAQMTWPDQESLARAKSDASLSLPDALPELTNLIQDIRSAWAACIIAAIHREPTPDKALHRHAMRRILRPYQDALRTQSAALRKWDGLAAVPDPQPGSTLLHVPTDDSRDSWMKARRQEYDNTLEGHNGLHSVKLLGQPLWEPQRPTSTS